MVACAPENFGSVWERIGRMCICSTASLCHRRRREVWINEKERNKAGLVFLALNGIEAKVNHIALKEVQNI